MFMSERRLKACVSDCHDFAQELRRMDEWKLLTNVSVPYQISRVHSDSDHLYNPIRIRA